MLAQVGIQLLQGHILVSIRCEIGVQRNQCFESGSESFLSDRLEREGGINDTSHVLVAQRRVGDFVESENGTTQMLSRGPVYRIRDRAGPYSLLDNLAESLIIQVDVLLEFRERLANR